MLAPREVDAFAADLLHDSSTAWKLVDEASPFALGADYDHNNYIRAIAFARGVQSAQDLFNSYVQRAEEM